MRGKLAWVGILLLVIGMTGAYFLNREIVQPQNAPLRSEQSSHHKQLESDTASRPFRSTTGQPLPIPPSNPNADVATQEVTPTFDSIKRMLDLSMQRVGASYVGHQPILRYADESERLSFIYRKGDLTSGRTLQELAQTAERGLHSKTEAENKMAQARANNDTNMIKEAARLQVQANRDIYQAEQCFTIEMSSSTTAPPLTRFQKGIPDWLAYKQTAFALASAHCVSPPQLLEVAESAPFSEYVFKFTGSNGTRIYVNPRTAQVFTNVTIRDRPAQGSPHSAEEQAHRQQRISAQWAEFMQVGIDVDKFNFSGLRDLSIQK